MEKDLLIIPKEIVLSKNIIFYLYNKWDIVYIWETNLWLESIVRHYKTKVFDEIKIEKFSWNISNRKNKVIKLIIKNKPKYNNLDISKIDMLKNKWYVNVEWVRETLKKWWEEYYKITNKLLVNIKKNCKYEYINNSVYVHKEDLNKFLDKTYNITLNF
jgi:hypothetical protein